MTNDHSARDLAQSRLQRLQEFLEHDSDNVPLLLDAAELEMACGDPVVARGHVQRVLELQPGDARALHTLSAVAIAEKSYDEAIAIAEQLTGAGHDDPAIRYNLAYALLASGRPEDARDLLANLYEEEGVFPAVVRLLIRACHYTGELERAIDIASKHLQSHPEDADVAAMLSLLYFDADDLPSAQTWAKRALEETPANPDALLAAGGVALASEDTSSAREFLNRGISLDPASGRFWMNLALADLLDFELGSAEQKLEHAVRYMPDHIGTWHILGWVRLLQGKTDGAETCFRKAFALDENFGETHGGLAAIAAARGDWHTAEVHSKIARRLDPNSMSSYYANILKLQSEGRQDMAFKLIESALKRGEAPGGGTLLDMLARRLRR